jgi:hypothetical protein
LEQGAGRQPGSRCGVRARQLQSPAVRGRCLPLCIRGAGPLALKKQGLLKPCRGWGRPVGRACMCLGSPTTPIDSDPRILARCGGTDTVHASPGVIVTVHTVGRAFAWGLDACRAAPRLGWPRAAVLRPWQPGSWRARSRACSGAPFAV